MEGVENSDQGCHVQVVFLVSQLDTAEHGLGVKFSHAMQYVVDCRYALPLS
jgi:hypothetical protein